MEKMAQCHELEEPLSWELIKEFHFLVFRDNIYCWCHTKRRLGWHQPSRAFFWYDTDNIICEDKISINGQCYGIYANLEWTQDL